MIWPFLRSFLICLLFVSSFEIRADLEGKKDLFVKDGLKIAFQAHRSNFSLHYRGNYLELKDGSESLGLYVRACNKRIVLSLDQFLVGKLANFYGENNFARSYVSKQKEANKLIDTSGFLRVNDKTFMLYEKRILQPSAYQLLKGIRDHMKMGRKLCAPKS